MPELSSADVRAGAEPVWAAVSGVCGVGKTSLVYHLAWMYGDQRRRVLVADLDPQANLTAAFLSEDRLEEINSTAVKLSRTFSIAI